jgi:OmpA-OmpF porin, OOP family
MKRMFPVVFVLAGALLASGCATKRYVRENTEPVRTKVDQVADQTNKQGATLDQTVKQVQDDERELNATKEIAKSAEGKVDTVGRKTDENSRAITDLKGELRNTIANIDNYKPAAQATVLFGFNKATLTPEAKEELDKLASQISGQKRYIVAVEGFTDRTGPDQYNLELSRRRADAVVHYLVVQHNIPVYRIQLVGLGKDKPADEGRNREARAKNRRVEITVFSASAETAQQTGEQGQQPQERQEQQPQPQPQTQPQTQTPPLL